MTIITLTTDELSTLKRALTDAADYRSDHGDYCGDCKGYGENEVLCEDHQADDALADAYTALLKAIPGRTREPEFLCPFGCGFECDRETDINNHLLTCEESD